MLESKENIKNFLAFSVFFCYNYIVVAKLIFFGGVSMHIERYKSNGCYYLRLVRSKRITNANGESIGRKELVLSLGNYAQYDDGKPNYLDRLRQSFREGTPLIPALLPYVEQAPKQKYTITFSAGDKECFGNPKRLAPCILDPAFAALGLDELFASIKHSSRIQYDLQGIVRLLTYGRLLEPASKMATMRQNATYYRPLVKSSNDDNVYDALDLIYENKKQIIQRMNTCITRGIGRSTSTVFYDVTNFFFEAEHPDEDELDEEGNVIERGLREMGVSKENRKQPIVQMGLFLDDNGIPISIEMFPGNTLDHLTFRTAMKNTVDNLDLDRFILIADRGITRVIQSLRNLAGAQERQAAEGEISQIQNSPVGLYASPALPGKLKADYDGNQACRPVLSQRPFPGRCILFF